MNEVIKKATDKWECCLVSGGAGFIGSHICEEALKLGKKVIALDNFVAGSEDNVKDFIDHPNFQLVEGDVSRRVSIRDFFENVDVVFHNAASKAVVCRIDPYQDLQVNAFGTFNICQCAIENKVKKVVHASTGSVYGEAVYIPVDEKHPLVPVSYYGVSKLAGERYLEAFRQYYGLNYSVLRYFHVYGSRQASTALGGVIPIFIRAAYYDKPLVIFGDGTQTRSFTYVKDDVWANFLLSDLDRHNGEVFNSASGIRVTINELAEMILRLMDKEHLKIKYTDWRPGDIKHMEVSNKKLGMEFETDFEKGLQRTIDWYTDYFDEVENG